MEVLHELKRLDEHKGIQRDGALSCVLAYREPTLIFIFRQLPSQKIAQFEPILTAAFTISQEMGTTKCPSRDERLNKMWSTYTMKYYAALIKKEICHT